MKTETRIVSERTNSAEIDAWIAPAFEGVGRGDLRTNNLDRLGSDDVPHLSLTQEARNETERVGYGDWTCTREVRWADHDGDPVGTVCTDNGLMSAGQYAVEFARRNHMRVKLTLRWPCMATA